MENKNKSITMPLNEMIDRLSEWFLSIASIVFLKNEETNEKVYTVLDNDSKNVIFEHEFVGADIEDEWSVMVSTAEIKNEELRGLVEQCYRLDQQLAESKASKESAKNQKGE